MSETKITFDLKQNPEPWLEPIVPSELLTEILETIKKYISCPEETAIAATLWITMTWFINEINIAPLALITAPEKRCGKTQFLTIIGKLVQKPLIASNISPAALYRTMATWQPTLLIDEVDTFMRHNEELRGIINCGHTRDSAYVIRTVGRSHTPHQFCVWGAKALSGIGKLNGTIMDRAIVLKLRRKLTNEVMAKIRDGEAQFFTIRSKLCRFAKDYAEVVKLSKPSNLEELNDREQDNWEPLFTIAELGGSTWTIMAHQSAIKLSSSKNKEQSLSIELLQDIHDAFEESNRLSTEELIQALCTDKEKPWSTYNNGSNISARQLAILLDDFDIHSKPMRFGKKSLARGYLLESFLDSFKRYLFSSNKVTTTNGGTIEPISVLPVTYSSVTSNNR